MADQPSPPEGAGRVGCLRGRGDLLVDHRRRRPRRRAPYPGAGLRFLDLETKVWSDFWINAKSGALGVAGLTGGFVDGVGLFTTDDKDADGKPVRYAGVWDQITGTSHRWRQGVSKDGGATWDYSWFMDWVKA